MGAISRKACVVKGSLVLSALVLVLPLRADQAPCEGCGLDHDHQYQDAVVTLTDWRTNRTHNYQSLWCALRDMHTKYPWSRARLTSASSPDLTITRAENRWDTTPADALALRLRGVPNRDSLVAFPREKELARWLRGWGSRLEHGGRASLAIVAASFRPEATPTAMVASDSGALPVEHWAASAVRAVTDAGLMQGQPDGEFHGKQSLTRYEMATILQRLLARLPSVGAPGTVANPGRRGPMDVIESELRQAGLPKAEARGLVEIAATPDLPPAPVVRAVSSQWPDVPQEHWAAGAVGAVTGSGLMNGYPDGMFRGKAPLTRYEIAVILKRLIERLDIKPQSLQRARKGPQVAPMIAGGQRRGAMRTTALAPRPDSDRQQALRKLQARGFTRKQAELALEAIQGSEARMARGTTSTAAQESTRRLRAAPPPLMASPSTSDPGLLGQSGLLVTPTADLHGVGSVSVTGSLMADGDSHAVAATTTLRSGTEVTAAFTSGDLPDAIILSAKHPIRVSGDGTTRAAIGVLDVTDEIDTTFYAVGSKDISAKVLGRRRPVTISAGVGGGDLLEGVFISGFTPLGRRTAAMVEWADVGHDDQINVGVSWAGRSGTRIKAGAVDGDLAVSLSLNRGF